MGRNVRIGRGELDLLVAFGRLLVAVEVKTLALVDPQATDPLRSYTTEKADQVHRLARALRAQPGRVDLMGVVVHHGGVDVRWVRGV